MQYRPTRRIQHLNYKKTYFRIDELVLFLRWSLLDAVELEFMSFVLFQLIPKAALTSMRDRLRGILISNVCEYK